MKEWLEKLPQVFYDKALDIKVRESLNNWLELDNTLLELKKITQLSEQSLLEYAKTKSEKSYHSTLDELHNIKYKLLKGDFNMKEIVNYVLENEITAKKASENSLKQYVPEKEAFIHLDKIYDKINKHSNFGINKISYDFDINTDYYNIKSKNEKFNGKSMLDIVINHLNNNEFYISHIKLNRYGYTEIDIEWNS